MIITPQALRGIYTAFNTVFNKAFEGQHPTYEKVATVVPSTSESETYAWLGDIPGMREWIGEREIQNLSGSAYTIKNKDFELTVGVDRNAVEDDKIGLYNPSIQMLGESAALHPDELVYGLLANGFTEKCYDGKAFFATDHPVGKDKASNKGTAKLSMDAYKTARTSMMSLKNSKGRPLALVPDLLVVPPTGSGRPRHPRRRLHQRHEEHHAGHGGDPCGASPRKRLRLVPALHQASRQAADLPAAQEGEVRLQDQRDRRQRLHEQEVHLRRRLSRQRGLRLLADGLRL